MDRSPKKIFPKFFHCLFTLMLFQTRGTQKSCKSGSSVTHSLCSNLMNSYDSMVWWANPNQSHYSLKMSPLVSCWEPDQSGSFRHFMINWFNVKIWLEKHIYESDIFVSPHCLSLLWGGGKVQDLIYIYIYINKRKLLLERVFLCWLFAQVHIKMAIFTCKHLDIKEREVMVSHVICEWVQG